MPTWSWVGVQVDQAGRRVDGHPGRSGGQRIGGGPSGVEVVELDRHRLTDDADRRAAVRVDRVDRVGQDRVVIELERGPEALVTVGVRAPGCSTVGAGVVAQPEDRGSHGPADGVVLVEATAPGDHDPVARDQVVVVHRRRPGHRRRPAVGAGDRRLLGASEM